MGKVDSGIGYTRLVELLRDITSTSLETRRNGCDSVTDLISEYSDMEALVVCHVLMCLALTEEDDTCQEAELNALVQMAGSDLVFQSVLLELSKLDRSSLLGSSVEHYDYLMARVSD